LRDHVYVRILTVLRRLIIFLCQGEVCCQYSDPRFCGMFHSGGSFNNFMVFRLPISSPSPHLLGLLGRGSPSPFSSLPYYQTVRHAAFTLTTTGPRASDTSHASPPPLLATPPCGPQVYESGPLTVYTAKLACLTELWLGRVSLLKKPDLFVRTRARMQAYIADL